MRTDLPPRRSAWRGAVLALAGIAAGCSYDPVTVGGGYMQGEMTAWRTQGLLVGWTVPVNVHVFTTGNGDNRDLEGRTVVLERDGDADIATQPGPTGANGWTSASLVANSAGTVVVHAYVEATGLPRVALPTLSLEFTNQLADTLVLEPKRFVEGAPSAIATGHVEPTYSTDLVVADATADTPRLLLVHGSCTFPSIVDEIALTNAPIGVTAADFDGDGLDEIALARSTGSTTADLGMYRWTSTGLISTGGAQTLAAPPLSLVTGVFASGGPHVVAMAEPLLAAEGQVGGVEYFAPATLAKSPVPMPSPPTSLASGRIDGDDRDDLVLVSEGVPAVGVLFGADPQRTAALQTGPGPVAAAIGDLNGDGLADLAIVTAAVDGGANELLVFLQDAPAAGASTPAVPTFTHQTPIALDGIPAAVAIGDLNRDDLPDVAVVTHDVGGGELEIFLRSDAGALVRVTPLQIAGTPTMLALAELTDDDITDVIVGGVGQPLTIYVGH